MSEIEAIEREAALNGGLAAALAKAQSEFPPIPREKEVTVQTKTGGSYKFKYAPLDSILNAVRAPLAGNGLALTQLMDEGDLVTMLLHKDGGRLIGRTPLHAGEGGTVQAFGSAVTYLRRYSIQAILGIAAEEDDDGNHASGNATTPTRARPAPPHLPPREDPATIDPATKSADPYVETEELIGRERRRGIIRKGDSDHYKLDSRQGPDGHVVGFRLETSKGNIPQVLVAGPLGEALYQATDKKPTVLAGVPATVAGILYYVKSNRDHSWYRLKVDRIETTINGLDVILPADPDVPLEEPPDDVELVGEAEAETAPLGLVAS